MELTISPSMLSACFFCSLGFSVTCPVGEGVDLLVSTVGSKRVKEEGVPFLTSLNTGDGSNLVCAIYIG